eukprot:TRINITY_DN4343_c0_g1_i1.p1 TRINITY_DN4343_c0_g1~~TRINITY_DN4343_c0_g1_i1.p1  ORF type:complete len:761 (-),score=190.67 TRINITY_DN4343_c0_g1_i1:118-2400(-)
MEESADDDVIKQDFPELSKSPSKSRNIVGGHLSYAGKKSLPALNLSRIQEADKKQTLYAQLRVKPGLSRSTSFSERKQKKGDDSTPNLPPAVKHIRSKLDKIVDFKEERKNGSTSDKEKTKLPPLASKKEGDTSENPSPMGTRKSINLTKSRSMSNAPTPKSLAPTISVDDYSNNAHGVREEVKMLPVIFRDFSLAGVGFTNTINALTDDITPSKASKSSKTTLTARANLQPNSSALKPVQKKSQTSGTLGSPQKRQATTAESPRIAPKEKNPVMHTSRSDTHVISNLLHKKSSGPWTTATILKQYKEKLSPYEQKEIRDYTEIFYFGGSANKIKSSSANANHGFDDEQGDYKIVVLDHIAFRYEVQGLLGKGTFGQVAKVLDHKTGKSHALKIIRNRSRYQQQALVEVKILDYMKSKDPQGQSNVIQTITSFHFRNHYCILFDLLSVNLYELIKANHFRGFSLPLIRKFAVQMLNSLRFLAKHHIIHCDLKPENVLLDEPTKSAITMIDFGSSCFEHEKAYTYIQSRFYRAPEVILGIPYTCAIDMWSLACILAELSTGIPIFPGESELDQLGCIMELLGVPSQSLLDLSTRKKYFFANGKPRIIENSQGIRRIPATKTLQSMLPSDDPLFINFISECLQFNPKDRMTPSQALQHPWILQLHFQIESQEKNIKDEISRAMTPPSEDTVWKSLQERSAIQSIDTTASESDSIDPNVLFSENEGTNLSQEDFSNFSEEDRDEDSDYSSPESFYPAQPIPVG